jgi:hypothetical protein
MLSKRQQAVFVALLMAGCQGAEDAHPPGSAGEPDAPSSTDTDVSPGRVTLASATGRACIGSFVAAGPNIYWTTPTNLMSAPKTGGASSTLAALGLSNDDIIALGLAVSGATAYWVDPDDEENALMAAPITAGAPKTTVSSGPVRFTTATSAGFFYLSGNDKIMSVPPGGSTPSLIATGNFGAITADGQSVYASTSGTNTIVSIPVRGGTPVTLATLPAASLVSELVTDGAYVYWVDSQTSHILRLPVGGGTPTTVFEPDGNDPCPTSLAVDGTSAYWTDACPGNGATLWKMPVGGGTPVRFATSPTAGPGQIAIDDASIYWWTGLCGGDETIVRITPK